MMTYLNNQYLLIKGGHATSGFKVIRAGMPLGSVLIPTFYAVYIADVLEPIGITLGTFADDRAYLATNVLIVWLPPTDCRGLSIN